VCFEVDVVVAIAAAAVVDPTVGAFDDPPARLDDEPLARFPSGHDVDGHAGPWDHPVGGSARRAPTRCPTDQIGTAAADLGEMTFDGDQLV
jgi:hypothetical protein